jgi:peptide/nickel transport system substrate-binding protein
MAGDKLRYTANRRRFLRDSTLASIGLIAAACAPGTTGTTGGTTGGAVKKGGEFHGAWPYVLPPAGHWNAYAPNGILTTGIFRHLWITTAGMYLWADKKFEYWLAESSAAKSGDNYELKLRSGIKWSDGAAFTA